VFPFPQQWLCERISMLRFTYIAFHIGKQYSVIGDAHWKNLSVDYTLGWGGNKNAVKKCQSYIY
jgi:hypothetical protein